MQKKHDDSMMSDWILIQTDFPNKCTECGNQIDKGDTAYWKKGKGIRCYPHCPEKFAEDKSELIIMDDDFEDYLK